MGDGLIVLLLLVLIAIGAALVVLPIVATVLAVKARRRARRALAAIEGLRAELQRIAAGPLAPAAVANAVAAEPAAADATATGSISAATVSAEPVAPDAVPADTVAAEPIAADAVAADAIAADTVAADAVAADAVAAEPVAADTVAADAAPAAAAAGGGAAAGPLAPARSWEERIGLVWSTRIGALLGIAVAGWFFKYMVDNAWIGPWGRVGLGWTAGLVLLVLGQALALRRRKPVHPVFVQGLLGLGLAVLLVASYAAAAFYHLLPVGLAFGLVAGLCLVGGGLALVHRAESILVLSLLAALANPVMLSTGVDRPLALFSYLLLLTAAALAAALRLGFRLAPWVAVLGSLALYAGWYATFFDPSPPPPPGRIDLPPAALAGAYHPLAARLLPLLFAGLFTGLWVGCGAWLHRGGRRGQATWLTLTAAVAAHAAAAGLLFDQPLLLGAVLCGLGLGFAALLLGRGQVAWLGLPMLAAFGVLAACTTRLAPGRLLPMLVLTGGLAAIYVAASLRAAARGARLRAAVGLSGPSAPSGLVTRLLAGGAGLGLAALAGLWLIPAHPGPFGLLITALAAGYAWLALSAASVGLLLAAFAASLLGLGAGALGGGLAAEARDGFLAVAALWFLIQVGAVAWDLFIRSSRASAGRLAVLAGAGGAFAALFLLATAPAAGPLRAGLALGAGLVYALVGARMLRTAATEFDRDAALLPLGLALALVTLALGLLLSGPGLTVTWAMEGAVLAWLAARGRHRGRPGHPGWLAASLVVLGLAAVRLLGFDLLWLDAQRALFWASHGASGTLLPAPFGHPLAWALAALGVACLLGARQLGRVRERPAMRRAALGLLLAGHVCLLGLLLGEVRLLLTAAPAVPAGLPAEEFTALLRGWEAALAAQQTRLATGVTVVLGLYSLVLLGAGFGLRDRLHRWLGLGLFGLALAKLGLYDIWALEPLQRIAAGAAIAGLLLTGAFLYGRHGARIRSLLAGDATPPPARRPAGGALLLVLAAAALAPAAPAAAADWQRYQQVAPIHGVDAPGDYVFELDPALHAASRARLADLRIRGPGGAETPWQLLDRRPVATPPAAAGRAARLLDPVWLPNGATRVVLDLGPAPGVHDSLVLDIAGRDYLRRTRLESAPDGRSWGLLAAGGFVFHVGGRCASSRRDSLHYPASRSRYLRLTLLPGADGQRLRLRSARARLAPQPPAAPAERRLALEPIGPPQHRDGRTALQLRLPAGLPVEGIALQLADAAFVRRVEVEATTRRRAWFPIGSGLIYRVPRQPPAADPPAAAAAAVESRLRVPVEPAGRPIARVLIADGDDPPLEIQGAAALWRPRRIVLRTASSGAHELYIGRAGDRAPRYDLAALRARGAAPAPRPVRLGRLAPNPQWAAATSAPPAPAPWSERHAGWIQLGIALAALGLILWTGQLIRRARRP